MKITEFLKDHIVYLDGGMGTLLQASGLGAGELPERWNLSHPEVIEGIHRAYFDAGTHVGCANTFGANGLKFDAAELEQIVSAAIGNARRAAEASVSPAPKWVALDIGPTGRMLKPLGDLDFEDAVSVFAEVVRLGVKYGADLIFIETMNDAYETKAALLAAKENSTLPVFVSNAYGADGKLMTGATPAAMVAMLEGLGAGIIFDSVNISHHRFSGIGRQVIAHSLLQCVIPGEYLTGFCRDPHLAGLNRGGGHLPTEAVEKLYPILIAGYSDRGCGCGVRAAKQQHQRHDHRNQTYGDDGKLFLIDLCGHYQHIDPSILEIHFAL